MATKIPPVEKFVVERGDVVEITGTVLDARDSGNVQIALSETRTALLSLKDLEAARVKGGRVVLLHPQSGEVLQDPKGKLGPQTLDESKLPDDPDGKPEAAQP